MNKDQIQEKIREFKDKTKTQSISVCVFDKEAEFFNFDCTENTLFEIASVTKIFTSILLDKVANHNAKLIEIWGDDKLSKDLENITLESLAGHTSGLPRLPDNINPAHLENPYNDYTQEDFNDFISKAALKNIGERQYSNLGYALLAKSLEIKAGKSYSELVEDYIFSDLGIKNSYFDCFVGDNFVFGFKSEKQVSNWSQNIFVGAGGIRSNTYDLSLLMSKPKMFIETKAMMRSEDIVWHNGMTGGYASFFGFDIRKNKGVTILSNNAVSVDSLANNIFKLI